MSRFAVVDLPSLFGRARHVVTAGDAYDKAGMAMQITFRSLRKLHREAAVRHMVIAADQGSWRAALYPAYKAKRRLMRAQSTPKEQEDSAVMQAALDSLLDYFASKTRCTVLRAPEIEADDFIARWIGLHPDDEHVIVSGDSDFLQLLAENVAIYDGVNDMTIRTTGVVNGAGQTVAFSLSTDQGKIKLGVVQPGFVPEPEWWRRALFVKLVRGDPGDGIFAAYPGVRKTGSSGKPGIAEAWADRHARGYHWLGFFHATWDKVVGSNADGTPQHERVRVLDEFERNTLLIDLTRQPDAVKACIDSAIVAAVQKPSVPGVGVHFLRFCGSFDLPALAQESASHVAYLNLSYEKA